jgi:hypothetical protein
MVSPGMPRLVLLRARQSGCYRRNRDSEFPFEGTLARVGDADGPAAVSAAEIGHQIVRRHEAGSVPCLDRRLSQRDRQVSFSRSGRTGQNDIGRLIHEPRSAQFADLALVDRGLDAEIELTERLQVRQVRQLQLQSGFESFQIRFVVIEMR